MMLKSGGLFCVISQQLIGPQAFPHREHVKSSPPVGPNFLCRKVYISFFKFIVILFPEQVPITTLPFEYFFDLFAAFFYSLSSFLAY